LNNITKKVTHYTKLYMKCAKKVYDVWKIYDVYAQS
jgi:hypothetical protein